MEPQHPTLRAAPLGARLRLAVAILLLGLAGGRLQAMCAYYWNGTCHNTPVPQLSEQVCQQWGCPGFHKGPTFKCCCRIDDYQSLGCCQYACTRWWCDDGAPACPDVMQLSGGCKVGHPAYCHENGICGIDTL